MSTFVWCEDSGSGFLFWKAIFKTLSPNAIVETKMDNSHLRKAANAVRNDGNEYYILMDCFVDNPNVLREMDALKRCTDHNEHVHIIDIYSFEFALLSFRSLIQWVFAENDSLKADRKDLIQSREIFLELVSKGTNMNRHFELENLFPYAISHNNEQIASELLFRLTRNTGFETNKKKLGDCFTINCCEWTSRQSDDLCGLDQARLQAEEKLREIVEDSVLKAALCMYLRGEAVNDNRV